MTYEQERIVGPTIFIGVVLLIVSTLFYTIGGTEGRVPEIQTRAPYEIESRGYTILHYEGYQRGSWYNHGGKVWYHVQENLNPNIRYRIYATLWNHQIMLVYGNPEPVSNFQILHDESKRP